MLPMTLFDVLQILAGLPIMAFFMFIFWFLPIFVIGGTGYFIYHLITKHKWTNDSIYMAMLAVCVVAWFYGISRGI